jgi:uncharacterized protein (TIGR02266 family)
MTQDTRKDRRAKIVSLNVRYKSATVDEFIDNHSHDVSKGGLFIKTASPFPPGTLLKFEIRIAGDKAVIAGVGRVVWKRETLQAGPEAPAGMGVKFIKIDDASRAVIDKLVLSRGEAKNAYDEGGGDVGSASATPERPSAQPSSAVVAKSVGPGAPGGKDGPKPGAAPPVAGSGGAARPHSSPFQPTPSASKFPGAGKSTIAGLGGIQGPAKAPRTPVPAAGRSAADSLRPRTAPSGRTPLATSSQGSFQGASSIPSTQPMFPKTSSEREMPPKNEQTVMKQAAELLEEALRGAGGSMEEIGQNPLFDLAKQEAGPAVSTAAVSKDKTSSIPAPRPGPGSGGASTSKSRPPSNESEGGGSGSAPKESPAPGSAAQSASPLVTAARPAQGDIETTVRSATRDETRAKPKTLSARPSDVSATRPLVAGSLLAEEEPHKNKWLVPVLAVAGVGVLGFLFYTRIYAPGADNPTAPTPPPSARTVESPSASASALPAGSVALSASAAPEVPSAAASTSASVSLDAAAAPALAASASAASPKPVAPAPAWHPPPKPKPKAAAAEEPPAATEGTPQPAAPPPPSESPPAPATASPAGTPSSAAIAPPAPSLSPPAPNSPPKPPAGKPKQEDDNPY